MTGYHKIEYAWYSLGLSHTAILIYSVMIDMQGQKPTCYFRQGALAKMLGCERKTVSRALNELQTANMIEIIPTKKGKSCDYRALFFTPSDLYQKRTAPVPKTDNHLYQIGTTTTRAINNQLKEPSSSLSLRVVDDVFFGFSGEPPSEVGARAVKYCANISSMAGLMGEEEWEKGWKDWYRLARHEWTEEQDTELLKLTEQVKQGYKPFRITAIICKRICKI